MWTPKTVQHILTSEAALGYLMHGERPVIGADGRPTRIAEPLWDRPTHDALVKATEPKRSGSRAPKGVQLLSGVAFCGNCGARLYLTGRRAGAHGAYGCTARVRGIQASAGCKPALARAGVEGVRVVGAVDLRPALTAVASPADHKPVRRRVSEFASTGSSHRCGQPLSASPEQGCTLD